MRRNEKFFRAKEVGISGCLPSNLLDFIFINRYELRRRYHYQKGEGRYGKHHKQA